MGGPCRRKSSLHRLITESFRRLSASDSSAADSKLIIESLEGLDPLSVLDTMPEGERAVLTNPLFKRLTRKYGDTHYCENLLTDGSPSTHQVGSLDRTISQQSSKNSSNHLLDELITSTASISPEERIISNPAFRELSAKYADEFCA